MTERTDFMAEAKEQVATYTCEGSHHNHDLIVGLLTEIERLKAEREELGLRALSGNGREEELRKERDSLRTEIERCCIVLKQATAALNSSSTEIERLRSLADGMGQTNIMKQIEIEQLKSAIRTTASEGTYDEMAIRKAVSFELAELIVTARATMEPKP